MPVQTITLSPPSAELDRRWRFHLRADAREATYAPLPDHHVSRAAAHAALTVLLDFCDPAGHMPFSTALGTISERSLLSRSTTVRALTYLCALGYVTRESVGGGGVKKTHYRVNVEAIRADRREVVRAPRRDYRSPAARPPVWAGKPRNVGSPGAHRGQAAGGNRPPKSVDNGSSLAPGTAAESPRFDCGHGLDLRCRLTSHGASSCPQCRAAGFVPVTIGAAGASRSTRVQRKRTSRRSRR